MHAWCSKSNLRGQPFPYTMLEASCPLKGLSSPPPILWSKQWDYRHRQSPSSFSQDRGIQTLIYPHAYWQAFYLLKPSSPAVNFLNVENFNAVFLHSLQVLHESRSTLFRFLMQFWENGKWERSQRSHPAGRSAIPLGNGESNIR